MYWVTALLPLSLALFPETGEIEGAWTCTGRGVFTLFVGRQADEDARSWTRCMGVGVAVLKV